jgi:RNA recognition motif-containing protein
MDYEDSMEWDETNRYSPTPVMRRNAGNSMYNRDEFDEDDLLDRNSRNHRGLSETLRSRLDSHQVASAKRARPVGHKIVISNLEPSVTSEDIRELFADIGDLLESRVVRPGVAEVLYERRADAIQAVDVYHNRQLDGRPMKCDMVRNAGSNAGPMSIPQGTSRRMPSRGADMYKPSAYVTYDIDAVHTALFNK